MLLGPVGPNIRVRNINTDKRPGHFDTFSINQVDLEWLTESSMSEGDAVKFVFQTVLSREPSKEEQMALVEYFESTSDDRQERFESLYQIVRQTVESVTAGIYEIKDDRLVVCFAAPGKTRPKKFGTGKDGGQIVMTFERVVPEE